MYMQVRDGSIPVIKAICAEHRKDLPDMPFDALNTGARVFRIVGRFRGDRRTAPSSIYRS
jgi:hypothetical protein